MAFFADLTEYTYAPVPEKMINVGWLDKSVPFAVGLVDRKFAAALNQLAQEPSNVMRGVHNCQFCEKESPIMVISSGRRSFLGLGEIHVRSKEGTLFAAPTLIAHYVEEHDYQPPEIFIDAVMAATDGQLL